MTLHKKQDKGRIDVEDLGNSFTSYLIRYSAWIYLFVIVAVVFGSVYLYNFVGGRKEHQHNLIQESEIESLEKKVELQDERLEDLERQINQLQGQ
ncbi:hypothetical protein SAMN05421767_14420 [Granulicatella balaenopterae]|uniref:Uncharacterized protein n=1 Tax=Granulicatella balaenopterae TaxID=137733 RepID=A0A1H9NRA2_9LACT|nr:hypothetical protein [Granulicatella balaenopterae]SER38564.1 hypothetical protein SAMN05421767_14420 [Granulicatella balaenopterae]